LAVHDAVNAIDPRYVSYIGGIPAKPGASVDAAVAAAARGVLVQTVPSQAAAVDAAFLVWLTNLPP
jgi:hypothetical protein